MDRIDRIASDGADLPILFRDDTRSNRISFRSVSAEAFISDLANWAPASGGPGYIITAMDAETFGHHQPGWEQEFLAAAYGALAARNSNGRAVRMVQPSELLHLFPGGQEVEPLASSWSTSADEIGAGDPFPLWRSPGNEVHALQWRLVEVVVALTATASRLAENDESRRYAELAEMALQPALQSCQFWWASRRPMWDPTLVYRGLALMEETSLLASRAIWKSNANAPESAEANHLIAANASLRLELEALLFGQQSR